MKVYARQYTIRQLCETAGITKKTLYRETRNLLKDPCLIEQIFMKNGGKNA